MLTEKLTETLIYENITRVVVDKEGVSIYRHTELGTQSVHFEVVEGELQEENG